MSVKVSIVIPTFGRPQRLRQALLSLVAQTHQDLEIIVVDDNPPTSDCRLATQAVLAEFTVDPRFIFVQSPKNLGGAMARNAGLAHATGEYLTFLDDDDEYLPEKVAIQLAFTIQNELDFSLCDMHVERFGALQESPECYAHCGGLGEFALQGNAWTPMIMVKAALAKAVGGFHHTARFQDQIFVYKLLLTGPRWAILREKLFVHIFHQEGCISSSPEGWSGYETLIEFERQFLPRLEPRLRRRLAFKHACVQSRLARLRQGYAAGVRHSFALFIHVRSPGTLLMASRIFFDNVLKAAKPF